MVGIRASSLVIMVRPHEQRNNHLEDDDQGMQARFVEAVRQAAVEAALQAMEDVYNLRLLATTLASIRQDTL